MRWLPRSLSGRLVIILVVGLILAQIIAAALSLHERDQALVHFSDQQWVQRDADAVRLMESLPAGERGRVAEVLTSPRLTVSLIARFEDAPADASPPDAAAASFQAQLRAQLPGHAVRGFMRHVPVPSRDRGGIFELGYRTRSITEVQLTDGSVARFDFMRPLQLAGWPYPLLVNLAVLLIAIIILALLAVRLATRPLTALAAAADRLGHDINRPSLPERGPVEVRRAARAFNDMQVRLKRYLEDRTRLLTAISHDLRTPITRLRLRTELLEDEQLKAKINKDLHDMESMTGATLDFLHGLEQGEAVQPMDLMALLESMAADAAEVHQPVSVSGALSGLIYARPQALKRCLENLITNAVRYGGRADIRVQDRGMQVEVRVRDHGPGIPAGELEKVFEPYYRLENSRSRESGGTGLGLGIARNIAEVHGGTLSLCNHPEGGLEAVLVLPRKRNGGG